MTRPKGLSEETMRDLLQDVKMTPGCLALKEHTLVIEINRHNIHTGK